MNVVLTKERLMEIMGDCFYRNGIAITVPSFFMEQKYAFQIEKIEKYSHEIGCMLKRVKHECSTDENNYKMSRTESKLGYFTMLGWLRYTEDDIQWCSIFDADCFCALGLAAGWLEVLQPLKGIFQDNPEIVPLCILLKRSSIKSS